MDARIVSWTTRLSKWAKSTDAVYNISSNDQVAVQEADDG